MLGKPNICNFGFQTHVYEMVWFILADLFYNGI